MCLTGKQIRCQDRGLLERRQKLWAGISQLA